MKDPSSAFRCTVGVFGLSLIQSREHPELYGEAHRLESFLKSPCSCAGAGARHYRIIGTALGGWGAEGASGSSPARKLTARMDCSSTGATGGPGDEFTG
jgi:hypothetical protein